MPLSLRERQAVVRELAARYHKAKKGERGHVLDEVQRLLGYNRAYAARALRAATRPTKRSAGSRPRRRGPKPIYADAATLKALRRVWAVMSFPSGKRLAPFMGELVSALERHGELRLEAPVRDKLLQISAATVDRLLAPERKRLEIRGRSGTKPGSLLKGAIPIKTFADWDDARPGFVEIDLVAHDGGTARGDYAQTLDIVDVATAWTETAAVPNKAQRWVFEALQQRLPAFPFPILGIDSDNGSEFINNQLMRFCEANRITFTRSRPYRKNDNCHVEQKNWAVVRRTVGYARYDSPEAVRLLNELYDRLRLYTNFFQPVQKLVEKEREGAKVRRHHDRPQTPYQRALASSEVPPDRKEALTEQYQSLNPAALRREITDLQRRLIPAAVRGSAASDQPEEVPQLEYISI